MTQDPATMLRQFHDDLRYGGRAVWDVSMAGLARGSGA
jgi:hypothetical protein